MSPRWLCTALSRRGDAMPSGSGNKQPVLLPDSLDRLAVSLGGPGVPDPVSVDLAPSA